MIIIFLFYIMSLNMSFFAPTYIYFMLRSCHVHLCVCFFFLCVCTYYVLHVLKNKKTFFT